MDNGKSVERETEGSLSLSVHAERKTLGQETGWMNVLFQWKTLDAMYNIFVLLGKLVCSHIIAPDSLLSVCAFIQTHTHIRMFPTCFSPLSFGQHS